MSKVSRVQEIYNFLEISHAWQDSAGLAAFSPHHGEALFGLAADSSGGVANKAALASHAQKRWAVKPRRMREALVEQLSGAYKAKRDLLAELIHLEAGKTPKEAAGEVDSSADVLLKTIKDTTLPDLGGMLRIKERPAAGVVGLITSFNFPLVVANWTLAPALLAGCAVVWKPSEKTALVAPAVKALFDRMAGEYADLLQVVIGGRDVGEALVACEQVDMISATGSVAMGQGIKAALARKRNRSQPPILELGGNNGVIISSEATPAHLEFAVGSILNSFLGTTGQRCTNTRRLIVHRSQLEKTISLMEQSLRAFLQSAKKESGFDPANAYGYGPLIDGDAFARFERAKAQVKAQGGRMLLGERLFSESSATYYVEPALAILPSQSTIMHEETFAPILFITSYENGIEEAMSLLNAPENAGLVSGIYTQSQAEADYFAQACEAGHALINSPKGTGTPAFGMGFGGNKHSGEGEILNSADPLQAFTRPGKFTRIAQNKDVVMTS